MIYIFSSQVEALAISGDTIIGISISGNSENVFQRLKKGKEMDCKVFGLSGNEVGNLNQVLEKIN